MPYLAKERTLLESVQNFACKVCCKKWNMDYESMLGHLNIPTLQQRRLQLKASMMYQFEHGDSYIPEDVLLLHPPSNYDTHNCSYFSVQFVLGCTYVNLHNMPGRKCLREYQLETI